MNTIDELSREPLARRGGAAASNTIFTRVTIGLSRLAARSLASRTAIGARGRAVGQRRGAARTLRTGHKR